MSAKSVTGIGGGSAGRVTNNRDTRFKGPRIVASGYFQTSSESQKYDIIFPRELKNGIDNYIILVTIENPLPDDGGNENSTQGNACTIRTAKLDSRWSKSEDNWIYDRDIQPGGMTGFVIHLNNIAGGGEGSRDTQVMWMVATIGYDMSECVDE